MKRGRGRPPIRRSGVESPGAAGPSSDDELRQLRAEVADLRGAVAELVQLQQGASPRVETHRTPPLAPSSRQDDPLLEEVLPVRGRISDSSPTPPEVAAVVEPPVFPVPPAASVPVATAAPPVMAPPVTVVPPASRPPATAASPAMTPPVTAVPPATPPPPAPAVPPVGIPAVVSTTPPVRVTPSSSTPADAVTPGVTLEAEHARMRANLAEFRTFQPPSFDGESDDPWAVERWVDHMQKLFRDLFIAEKDKVPLATHFLMGEADRWWSGLLTNRFVATPLPLWKEFKEILFERFFKESTKQSLEWELEKLRQGDRTVREYEREFSRIVGLVPFVYRDERHKAREFRKGLRYDIRRQICTLRVQSFDECVDLALAAQTDIELARSEREALGIGKNRRRSSIDSESGQSSHRRPPKHPRSRPGAQSSQPSGPQDLTRICAICRGLHKARWCPDRAGCYFRCGQPGHLVMSCPQ